MSKFSINRSDVCIPLAFVLLSLAICKITQMIIGENYV
jgi:hypothetical protein